jgi:hypothetical protein
MIRRLACAAGIALLASTAAGAKSDPRLATFTKAYVLAVDNRDHDQRVAACVADHLHSRTALELVRTHEAAEVILRVKVHLTSSASRAVLGSWGASPSGVLEAQLPNGTTLWVGRAKYRRPAGITRARDVECGVADGLLAALQNAIRKAREGT